MKSRHYVTLVILLIATSVSMVYKLPLVTNLVVILLFVAIYFFVSEIFNKQAERDFLERNLLIAKQMILESNDIAIMIVRNKKIIWANDYAYNEFPILLEQREIKSINLDELDLESKFSYKNKTYKCDISHHIYKVSNITNLERQMKILEENKPNIAILQIDNYESVTQVLSDSELIEFERGIRSTLLKFFSDNKIYYVQLGRDRFQLMIPTSLLEKFISDKFETVTNIADEFKEISYTITLSMGVATNFETALEASNKANEALDLAINRGGAQTVLFEGENRQFFGGKVNVVSGSIKMKARLMANTILNIASKRDVVYLMTHVRPDSDGLASIALMYNLLKQRTDAEVKILIDNSIDPKLQEHIDILFSDVGYYYDVVVDHTKRNLLLILDTQSKKLVSNAAILSEIEDVIVVDHHQTPLDYLEYTLFNWIEPTSSSTTELISEILNVLHLEIEDQHLANFALLGVLTDTNNLNFRTGVSTLETVTNLVSYGANINDARKMQYIDFDSFLKINELLSTSYVMDNYAIMRTQIEKDDVILSICANNLIEIENIICSIVISEIKDDVNMVKIRSDGTVNARELIEEFGGGGHLRQAAGILNDQKVHKLLQKINQK